MPSSAVARRWRLETVIQGVEIHIRNGELLSSPAEAVGRIAIKIARCWQNCSAILRSVSPVPTRTAMWGWKAIS